MENSVIKLHLLSMAYYRKRERKSQAFLAFLETKKKSRCLLAFLNKEGRFFRFFIKAPGDFFRKALVIPIGIKGKKNQNYVNYGNFLKNL